MNYYSYFQVNTKLPKHYKQLCFRYDKAILQVNVYIRVELGLSRNNFCFSSDVNFIYERVAIGTFTNYKIIFIYIDKEFWIL